MRMGFVAWDFRFTSLSLSLSLSLSFSSLLTRPAPKARQQNFCTQKGKTFFNGHISFCVINSPHFLCIYRLCFPNSPLCLILLTRKTQRQKRRERTRRFEKRIYTLMKSVVAFAFGAIAGIFGFQKHRELRGATKTSSSSKNAIVEAKRTTGEDAAPAKEKGKKRTKVIGVIPARYASTRFPGKPLVMIAGKPMIVRTYLQAKKATQLDAGRGDRRRTNSRRDRQGRWGCRHDGRRYPKWDRTMRASRGQNRGRIRHRRNHPRRRTFNRTRDYR